MLLAMSFECSTASQHCPTPSCAGPVSWRCAHLVMWACTGRMPAPAPAHWPGLLTPACCRGPAVGAGESEDAEYAWLQAESLRPFSAGDASGNPDGILSGDATLQACVAAADRAVQVRGCCAAQGQADHQLLLSQNAA